MMNVHAGKVETQLAQLSTKIDELKTKGDKLVGDAKRDYTKSFDDLKNQQKAAHTKLDALKAVGDDKWDAHKAGIEKAVHDMETAFTKLSKN